MQPKPMLFDEPTSAPDPELVGDVLDAMRGLARDGMTMIIVTHAIGFAREVADSGVFMDAGMVVRPTRRGARGAPARAHPLLPAEGSPDAGLAVVARAVPLR